MKPICLALLGFSLFPCAALADPQFSVEPIFPPQEKHVHSSSMVQCPNGDLMVAWFHGSGERTANDVVIQGARKKKGADTWSAPFLMADTPDLPDCNPVLFIDAKERLWLFWIPVVANGWQHGLLKYRRADDYHGEGAPAWSWQDVIILDPGEAFPEALKTGFEKLEAEEGCWAEYALPYEEYLAEAAGDKVKRTKGWMTRNHPTVLPDGRILLPLYSDGFNLSLIGIPTIRARAGGPAGRSSVTVRPSPPSCERRTVDWSPICATKATPRSAFNTQRHPTMARPGALPWIWTSPTPAPASRCSFYRTAAGSCSATIWRRDDTVLL